MGVLRRPGGVVVALVVVTACGGGGTSSSSLGSSTSTSGPTTTASDTSTTGTAPGPTVTTLASGPTTTAASAPTTGPHPPTTVAATTTIPSQAPTAVALADADTGRTVTVHRGGTVTVVLHSTYWTFAAPSNGTVLQAQGTPVVAPDMQHCVPGGGCGTVTARYVATGDGQSAISAHRDSCGEAMRCQGTAGDWRVTVVVTG